MAYSKERVRSSSKCDVFQVQETEKPVQLLVFDEDTNKWSVDSRAADILRNIFGPLYIIAIVGEYRTGKSYLMNRLSGKNDGFALGPTVRSETKGIWMLVKKHPRVSNATLLLLDSEGLGDVEKGDETHDMQIFTLVLLLCKTLIFNTMHTLKDAIVKELHLVTELASRVQVNKGKKAERNALDLTQHCPHLFVVVRDFFLRSVMGTEELTDDQYLENSLKLKDGGGKKTIEFNAPRESIQQFFEKRNCFTLCRPVHKEDDLRCLDKPGVSIRPEFIRKADRLVEAILKETQPSTEFNSFNAGTCFLNLANEYARAINDGQVPCIESSRNVMVAKVCEDAMNLGLQTYKQAMEKKCSDDIPIDSSLLGDYHDKISREAADIYKKHAMVEEDDIHLKDLMINIEEMYEKIFKVENIRKSRNSSDKALDNCFMSVKRGIEEGTYIVKGGHKKYEKEKMDAERRYETWKDLGPCKETVLNERLEKMADAGQIIHNCDENLTDAEKEQAVAKENLKVAKRREEELQKKNKEMKSENEKKQKLYKDLADKTKEEHNQKLREKEQSYNGLKKKLDNLIKENSDNKEKVESLKAVKKDLERDTDKNNQDQAITLQKWEAFNKTLEIGVNAMNTAASVTIMAAKCSVM